jgi:peptidoglycan/LPS O-acetylase OafA/YrhL
VATPRPAAGGVPAPGDQGRRIPGLDGLRAIAACSILIYHASSNAVGTGPLMLLVPPLREGVTLFFCLSGFLLYRTFAAAMIRGTRRPSIRRYALRRLLRIAPAYWLVLVLTTLVLDDMTGLRSADGLSVLGRQALLVANYSPRTIWSGLTPSWSLAIELVFYIALPVLAVLATRLVRNRPGRRAAVAAACVPPLLLLAVGVIGKLAVTLIGGGEEDTAEHSWHAVFDGGFLTHADLFSFGMGLAVLHVLSADGALAIPAWVDRAIGRALLYLGPLFLVVGMYTVPAYLYHPVIGLLAAVLLAKLVLPARRASAPGLMLRTLERPAMVYLGVISYSIFLWNNTVTVFLREHHLLASANSAPGLLLDIGIVACVTLALSALTYRYVERPFLNARPRHAAEPPASDSGRLSRKAAARAVPTRRNGARAVRG